jgi:DNA polymerase-3 subunit epsilon
VRELLHASTAHYGTPNGVFRWRRGVIDALFALLETGNGEASRQVLERFCRDYAGSRYGYPDLLVLDDDEARFVEVKTEGDQLRRNQLLRIEQLRAAGFRADVVRVRWTLDPAQAYVVVDVETTGGRGDNHRVTEIGAVKLQDGEIVGRFSTLLNPQRPIPPGISRLTGITPAMVEDAPYFSDVADEFEAFMQGGIFVAHNVEFDYGFIAREFERIGRKFRYPRLCTCASMRRLYPGQRSYSLAALAEAYDIPLRNHHRALCDAEAAAQLLLIINEKRAERLAQEQEQGA